LLRVLQHGIATIGATMPIRMSLRVGTAVRCAACMAPG